MLELSALEEAVSAILWKLPIKPEAERHIPIAAVILVETARLPRGRPTRGDAAAIRELSKLAAHLRSAVSILSDLSAEASFELRQEPVDPNDALGRETTRDLVRHMITLERQAISVNRRLEAKRVKRPGRRKKDIRASSTAVALLGFYEEFTGKKASITIDATRVRDVRVGEFVRLVTDVFKALGISASPSAQAAAAVKRDDRFGLTSQDFVDGLTLPGFRKGLLKTLP